MTVTRATVVMAAAAAVALALATRAPLALTVLGFVAFGLLHNVLELRYVFGRFGGTSVLSGRLLHLLLALITGVMLCRLFGLRMPEIVLGYAVLAAGAQMSRWRLPVLAALAAAATVSWHWPAYHFVILTHLHNLVPLVFLWDWAGRIPDPFGRKIFRATQVAWVLAVPALLLTGAFDSLATGAVPGFAADAATPAGITGRFLTVFAFLQTMHYVVWVGFLPRFAPEATAAFERRVPALRGPRAWALGLGAGALLAILLVADYAQGRALYSALATYHAYLEFPVILALLLGTPMRRPVKRAVETLPDRGSTSRGVPTGESDSAGNYTGSCSPGLR